MRRGFTLIELMVVMAMIVIIAASFTSGIAGAQKRAKISRAQTDVREMTNAILAYANYDEDGSLQSHTMENAAASESSLAFILGKERARGVQVPVLYNAHVSQGGEIRDPWGNPYRVTVKKGDHISPPGVANVSLGLFYPNWHRLTEGER